MSKSPELPPEDGDRTVYQPKGVVPPAPPSAPVAAPAPLPDPPRPSGSHQQIADGAVLNGIYRITRFIAKGGMGEVYQAVNVHQLDDRVAVKVMLQHLAQDELVAAMFAKEAATLTRLNHEAIVQYRLAARDSEGRPYIVTEYIDGPNLEDMLGTLRLSDADFLGVAQKLAAGLGTAHTLGAIHRDIAPDNILLAGGDPARPKIIDFGIAKDAREQSGTIVGDGFAGKLRYVAPEQLGEYGRNIGPWTDIYSLALTLRAVVAGKHSDMGGSMADAVRKRMSVPDLSDIPPPFRLAFEAALQPDPALRPQSMAAFNVMLASGAVTSGMLSDGTGTSFVSGTQLMRPTPALPAPPAGPGLAERLRAQIPAGEGKSRLPLLIGGGAVALVALVGLVIATSLGGGEPSEGAPAADVAGQDAAPAPAGPAKIAPGSPEFAALVARSAAGIPCAWLTLADAGSGTARFTGAAAVPAEAQTQLAQALEAAGAEVATRDFADVLTFPQANCAAIDALRDARSDTVKITTPQTNYEMRNEEIGEGLGTELHSKVQIQITGTAPEMALMFFSDLGAPVIYDSERTRKFIADLKGTQTTQGTTFNFPLGLNGGRPENGGVVVISSDAPLPANITTYDAAWPQRFREGAKAGRWKADAVWFRVENRQPG